MCGQQSSVNWDPPDVWTGPPAALYRSFNDNNGLILKEETQPMNSVPFVTGKVRNVSYNYLQCLEN